VFELADVALDMDTADRRQPNADVSTPRTEVTQIGQIGGMGAVVVAEQEAGDQALVRRGFDQQRRLVVGCR
jgi:hypothetical protein